MVTGDHPLTAEAIARKVSQWTAHGALPAGGLTAAVGIWRPALQDL
jgi:cation transport ATPase